MEIQLTDPIDPVDPVHHLGKYLVLEKFPEIDSTPKTISSFFREIDFTRKNYSL